MGEPRRIAVRVTPDAERWIRAGHPWVYEHSVTSAGDGGAPGDLAVVFDRRRRFCAIGLWDPTGPIRVRVLHSGSPTPIDADWWRERVRAAVARRAALAVDPSTTAYRLVHGENDGLPGLVADLYGDSVVVKIDTAALVPHLPVVVTALVELLDPSPRGILLRTSRRVRPGDLRGLGDGQTLVGDVAAEVTFRENGLQFVADLRHGQKTGHFLDQRDNRALLGERTRGAVLDVFCCTGGFALNAAAGGSASVTLVDQSGPALATAKQNLAANRDVVGDCGIQVLRGDAFEVMARLRADGARYDVVVVDPPSFAHRRGQVAGALAAHRRLTEAAVDLLVPGGLLVHASCSSRVDADHLVDAVTDGVRTRGRDLEAVEVTGHPLDHPVGFAEGAYLTAVWGTVT